MKPILFALAAFLCLAANAQNTVVAKIKGWSVIKQADAMTDKTTCYGVYTKQPNIVLFKDKIWVSMKEKGGIDAVQFRFDKDKASDFVSPLPSDGHEAWWFGDMDRIVASSRLQLRIAPLIGRIVDYDIDLTPAKELHEIFSSAPCS